MPRFVPATVTELTRVGLLQELPGERLAKLAQNMRRFDVPAGSPIVFEGEQADHFWWLDRMVRTSRPLVERMALVWHDWFATSNAGVGSQQLMLRQNTLFRRHGLGSFDRLLFEATANPAMLLWLNGT